MRPDSLGLFWRDEPPPPKVKKEKIKRTPPEPIWLEPGYLPNYDIVKSCSYDLINDASLIELCEKQEKQRFLFDIECYTNYFLVAFQHIETKKYLTFELSKNHILDLKKLKWVLETFIIIGFNSKNYDIPIVTLALAGLDNAQLKDATNLLIQDDERPADVLKKYKAKKLKCDHIDLIEVAPGQGSLKLYGGRLHTEMMQDLPFPPNRILNEKEIEVLKWYCVKGDLAVTNDLYCKLENQIKLREHMSLEYGVDVRSKSDAQIAESVIGKSIQSMTGLWPQKANIVPGASFRYQIPQYLKYKSPLMNWVLEQIRTTDFVIGETGRVLTPDIFKENSEINLTKIKLSNAQYKMGIGGLHSSETVISHHSDDDTVLVDRDVTSYYPAIILNQQLFPKQLGFYFLDVYRSIVDRRLQAKRAGDKLTSDTLKILINGSFGKLGSPHSILYSPELLVQVTLTGQLSLLMLIERLELVGINVVSANTDGVVIKCPKSRYDEMDAICKQWEFDTQFDLEETQYKSVYSRDVNNYLAIKTDGEVKSKGAFADYGLQKNPTGTICVRAAIEYLTKNKPIEETIRECGNIRDFITVRTVKGGGVKVWDDQNIDYLGKAVRWYYAEDIDGEIVYAKSGNKVAKSESAKPIMKLPLEFPTDINYNYYVEETKSILSQIGYDEQI